jgi:type I restriction enzyme S subunit
LRQFPVLLPPKKEQQKISDIFGTWDEALEKLDVLIAAKERRKKGLTQQLLNAAAEKAGHGQTRHRVGSVVERVTRKNTIGSDNVLTISAQDGLINQREYFNRSVAGADLSGYFLLHRGEFAYNRSSSIGYPYGAIKRMDRYDQGIVSTLYLCFRVRDTVQISSDYLAHYLDGGYLNSGLRSIAKEGARAHGLLNVTADEFMDLDVFSPPLPLQEKIATVLDAADTEISNLRDQRAAINRQKRGLMQQLLTGKLRVKVA